MKTIVAAALAAILVSGSAYAADAPIKIIPGSLSFNTETEHSIENETTTSEFGVAYSVEGLTLSLAPTYDWDKSEINDVEFGAQYDIAVTDRVTISPYGKYNIDKDFETTDQIIGIKTSIKLF